MINFNAFLEQLNLSEIEASLYTTLLDNGPMSVRDLAVLTKMKRTTAYFYIDQLIEKGLVMKLIRGTQKLVSVSQPKESLKYLVEEKSKTAQTLKQEFPDMLNAISTNLPQLETSNDAEIRYFKGVSGVKKIYEDALKSKELRSYVNLSIMENVFPENLHIFSNAFNNNPLLKIYEIVEDSPYSRKQTEHSSQNPQYFYKFLPKDIQLSAADTLIYDGKVSIINVGGQITGIILTNMDYYRNSKELFDLHWRELHSI
ncbi:MAG: TrmB family transcriptional regulator [Candidatus Levyibacteriota bacterium]